MTVAASHKPPMAAPVAAPDVRDCVTTVYAACSARDPQLLSAILHDRIDWLLAGPADQFDFYGRREGKDEVIVVLTRILPCYFQNVEFEVEKVLVQGDRAVVYGHVRARQRDTGRWIRYGFMHFLRFEQGRLISLRGIGDTFDLAEQIVGHRIDVNQGLENVPLIPDDDLSTV